jgi:small-conductance mechanosensitive channel
MLGKGDINMQRFIDLLSQPGGIARWLETQIGLPKWFIMTILTPIVSLLLAFLLRELALRVAFLIEKRPKQRKVWRSISLYLTILLAILGIGFMWKAQVTWLAESLASVFGKSLAELEPYLIGGTYAVVSTLILVLLAYLLQSGFRAAVSGLGAWAEKADGVRIQKTMLLSPNRMRQTIVLILRIVRLVIFLVLFYYYIPLMLSFFPVTAPFAHKVMPYVTGPTVKAGNAIVRYLPKLATLILIIVSIKYLLKLLRFFFSALGKDEIKISGFDPDWAEQTFRLIRIVVILVGVMICYPFLPGAGSEIFKGFSIFVGALVTFGSTSAVNNIVSGIVLTYTRAFRVGDRVHIGDTRGDIIEKKLFVTRLRTFKNEEVVFPNGEVLGSSIVNLSAAATKDGLAVMASAGIGYDVDWRTVSELMKKAAQETSGILSDPEPFVLESELGDFAVT